MDDPTTILSVLDGLLMTAGGLLLMVHIVLWRRGGGGDQLRGCLLRPNRLGLLMVWFCFLANLVGLLIGGQVVALLYPRAATGGQIPPFQAMIAANISQILVAGTCLLIAHWRFSTGLRGLGLGRRPFRRDLWLAVFGWLVALCVCGLVFLATRELIDWIVPGFDYPLHSVLTVIGDPQAATWMRVFVVVGALILAPVSEELFFRGIVQTAVKKIVPRRWGSVRHRWIAIGITAVFFGMMHTMTPHHIAALACLGAILGYLYERSGSLVVPILVHILFNGKTLLWVALSLCQPTR